MNPTLITQPSPDTGTLTYTVEFDYNGRRKRTAWTDTPEHAHELWARAMMMTLKDGADK